MYKAIIFLIIINLVFYITAFSQIKRGDIFISTSNSLDGLLVQLFTNQRFFHTGIVLNPDTGWVVHSRPSGTEFTHRDIKKMVSEGKMKILRYKKEFTPQQRIQLLNNALAMDAQYNYVDMFKIVAHKITFGLLYKQTEGITCVELVATLFQSIGLPIQDGANDFLTVVNFLTSPKLEVVNIENN